MLFLVLLSLLASGILFYKVLKLQAILKPLQEQEKHFIGLVAQESSKLQQKFDEVFTRLDRYYAECNGRISEESESLRIQYRRMLEAAREEVLQDLAKAKQEWVSYFEAKRSDFKVLMDNAYLDEYEKMRRSPPKPKKGPRKRVEPPRRYRSLDDDDTEDETPA